MENSCFEILGVLVNVHPLSMANGTTKFHLPLSLGRCVSLVLTNLIAAIYMYA